jgi:nitrate reductase beta subunit
MRSYMRDINLGRDADESIPRAVGMTGEQMYDMYRLLALAKYDERYVIPPAHAEQAHSLEELATECSLDYEGGPGHGRLRAVRRGVRRHTRSPWRTSTCSRTGQTTRTPDPLSPGRQARPA